ncbi:helix-turn-helix transcriptional regulator [Nakamurella leprariae]|uniref:WYL domain-containing protein n=1 Tax=Nakamurella leprariae TaxID=2803911 RepID=A0A938YBU2_9ACTN|nr:WYL domain-containing protein [Nakamurella leprariae]MBM9466768.1 WYL domain-containing protein [Nakamurella leprariae]
MATAKAERLLNLVIALVNAPRYRTAGWIREHVAGYGDAPSDEAFFRMFERDKQELRALGIPVQTQDGVGDGYRIQRADLALPHLRFTPAEGAALALAGRLWETTALAAAGAGALRKIRDATDGAPLAPASDVLQPRVRTADPAFAPLYTAVRDRRLVTFPYRTGGAPSLPARDADSGNVPGAVERTVEPWGLVSRRGRWYLVGWDRDRQDRRVFRLSRIAGAVTAVGRAGAVIPPVELDLAAEVADRPETQGATEARLLIREGRAAGLRRSATYAHPARSERPAHPADAAHPDRSDQPDDRTGWDEVVVPVRHLIDTARSIAEHGPDVLVLDPPELRDAVIAGLRRSVAAGPPAPAPGAPAPTAITEQLTEQLTEVPGLPDRDGGERS